MHPAAHAHQIFSVVEFSGVVVGALGGALEVKRNTRYNYDVIGLLGLAFLSALGGGILRDMLIGNGPPLAFQNTYYLLDALLGATLALLIIRNSKSFHPKTGEVSGNLRRLLIVIDAASLGLFSVAGATRAVDNGLSFLPALLLGVTTAVGGGSLRDVFTGRTPRVFERGEPYAIASICSVLAFFACEAVHFSRTGSTVVAIASGFLLRILSVRYRWRTASIR
jgi:uncharacterized membrane protein YeiH